jgi:hypothetical protein
MDSTQHGEPTQLPEGAKKSGRAVSDIPLVLLLLIISVGTIISSLFMPRPGGWATAPGLFPLIIGIVLLGMSLGLLSMSIRDGISPLPFLPFGSRAVKGDDNRIFLKRIFVAIGGILVYCLVLIPLIHFTAATIIYLAGTLWYFWRGKLYIILIISVLASLFLAATFSRIFQIILP